MGESYDDFPRAEETSRRELNESLNPTGPSGTVELLAETLMAISATMPELPATAERLRRLRRRPGCQ